MPVLSTLVPAHSSSEMSPLITPQHQARWKRFFDGFGYLHCPGLLADDDGWITEAYEETFARAGIVHEGTKRISAPIPSSATSAWRTSSTCRRCAPC